MLVSVYIPRKSFTNLYLLVFHAYLKSGAGFGKSLRGVRWRYAVSVSMVLSRDRRRGQGYPKTVAPMSSVSLVFPCVSLCLPVSLVRTKTFSTHVAFKFRHVVSKSGHFTHDKAFFQHDVRRKRFNTRGESHCMEMTISKDHVAEKPRGGGTSGGMVAHDLVKAAEKVLLIA